MVKHRAICGPSRREVLRAGGKAALFLSLASLVPRAPAAEATAAAASSPLGEQAAGASARTAAAHGRAGADYRRWEDVFRKVWRWDRVARSSHFVNCWYQAHCAWNVYVKEGLVWREEQAAAYPPVRADVPDFNPRGCQKGACYSARMYDPTRVRYPLKRVGERGSGRWRRVSWEEALAEIADAIIDVLTTEGSDRIIWDIGPLYTLGTMSAAQGRLAFALDSTGLDVNGELGDAHPGAAVTFGKITAERSADDYCFSDLILIWGSNPIVTQIPNAHFLTEARYRGAEIVTISPDYSPSAIHADRWIPVNLGSDAALALSLVQVILAEGRHDSAFLKEQTDMPLLVREDTGRFLRRSDLEEGGSAETFYVKDQSTGKLAAVPSRTLSLGSLDPALEAAMSVETPSGAVRVRTVMSLLRERLERDYTPERTAQVTGVAPAVVRALARRIAGARAVSNVTSSNIGKYYHGALIERAQILVFAVCGHMGKKGSGFSAFPFLTQDGCELFMMLRSPGLIGKLRLGAEMLPLMWSVWHPGMTAEMFRYEMAAAEYSRGLMGSATLFWLVHGGLMSLAGRSREWDPHLPREPSAYLEEALGKHYQRVWPPRGHEPRILFEYGSNCLRRVRGSQVVARELLPKLRALITIDSRMTSTALFSDYVLPAAAWYERSEHKWGTPLMPYIHGGGRITRFAEALSDWEICARLARAIQERARARGMRSFRDRHGSERRLDTLFEEFSMGGRYTEKDEDKVAAEVLALASNVGGVSWEELKERGFARFSGVGKSATSIGNACEVPANDTIIPFTHHVHGKQPYPTLTRRIQLYIDHPFYLELGEALPVHKDPPRAGGNYPLFLSGAHARWSIHASWRDDARMLRLQRGEPIVYLSPADAGPRDIADGDLVEVRNDIGSFRVRARLSRTVRPGQVLIYHAWENYQFRGGQGYRNVIPSPLNPIDLAGGEGHLRPTVAAFMPGQSDRDTRVEVVRVWDSA